MCLMTYSSVDVLRFLIQLIVNLRLFVDPNTKQYTEKPIQIQTNRDWCKFGFELVRIRPSRKIKWNDRGRLVCGVICKINDLDCLAKEGQVWQYCYCFCVYSLKKNSNLLPLQDRAPAPLLTQDSRLAFI